MATWLWLASLPVVLCLSSAPRFNIDLDLEPRERYREVHEHYRQEVLAMLKSAKANMEAHFTPEELANWTDVIKGGLSGEFLEELEGIQEVLNLSASQFDLLILQNVLYELESPTLCSGFVGADPHGKVIHGRNMDYRLMFRLPNGTFEDWPNVTYEALYYKEGSLLFMTIGWAGYTGAHTGMRFGGWTIEQNTRPGNNATLNLEAGRKGGIPFGWFVRNLLATVPDFETAVQMMNSTSFMAPQYFIMAGSKPFEGAVISMDRLAAESLPTTPPVRRLGRDGWYLLQTNDDVNKLPRDPRRPATNFLLMWHSPKDVTTDNVWNLMLGPTLHDFLTVFTWVAVPSTNYSQLAREGDPKPTVLLQASQAPLVLPQSDTEEVILAQRFMKRSLKKSPPVLLGGHAKRWRHVVSDDGIRLVPVEQ